MPQRFGMSVGAHPGGVAGVEEVNAALAAFAEEHSLPTALRRSLSVALDELLANALSHGMAGRDAGMVTVEVEMDQDRLTVTVADDGPAFDPLARSAPDTTSSLEERPIGGLGLHLVRRLVDEVSYERRSGRNVVVLVKQLARGQDE